MRPQGLLVIWFLWVGIQIENCSGDQASDFLALKETQVMMIASNATVNAEQTCDLVASCDSECSRGACSPLQSDHLTCTYVAQNQRCYAQPYNGTHCNNQQVNFDRSYVRTPQLNSSDDLTDVSSETRNAICSQRKLDPVFRDVYALQKNASTNYYSNFYFGSVGGSFRFYPGVEVKDCYKYDPRKRPWYTGAISVIKDIVVLLDSGYTMGDTLPLATIQMTRFGAAQTIAQEILKCLTSKDRATVISFGSAEANVLSHSFLVPAAGLNTSAANFEQLLLALTTSTVSGDPSTPGSNFSAAFNEALSTFDSGSPPGALKIVMVFTDGASNASVEDLTPIITQFKARQVRLLIYDVGSGSNPSLGEVACQVQGYTETLNAADMVQNPLYSVNSYFSFLARSQQNTTVGSKPFWQPSYVDYGNLGSVITVAYPVMSADKFRLVGVVAIDVQLEGLLVSFQDSLDNNIVGGDHRYEISVNFNGASFGDCNPAYNASGGQCSSPSSQSPLCKSDDDSRYEELVCCAGCSMSSLASTSNSQSKKTPSVIPLVVGPLAAVTALSLIALFWFKCFRPREQPSPFVEFVKIPKFTYHTLWVATDEFSEKNKLGSGTFGEVYLGTLDDGTDVAVKKLKPQGKHEFSDFEAEIRVLATANHTNLVALKGFCIEQHHLLVYEFVQNRDLDYWLFVKPEKDNIILQWRDRVIIAKGIARGLAYLHEELQNSLKVCHSDIKPANILLDKEFNPKVADFGMAKLYEGGGEIFATGGTLGYVAPEIRSGAPATNKADVFSYGMVLLEMLSGRRFYDSSIPGRSLQQWAASKVRENREMEFIDHLLGELDPEEEEMGKRLIDLALLCTSDPPDGRPDMSTVVKIIESSNSLTMRPSLLPVGDEDSSSVNSTFPPESSILDWSRSRSDVSPASETIHRARTWTFMEALKNLQMRSVRSAPTTMRSTELT